MLYAKVLRPPVHGATLVHLDTEPANTIAGAMLVADGDFVAALHADPGKADDALALVAVQWRIPESALDPDSIFSHLVTASAPLHGISQRGNVAAQPAQSQRRFASEFQKGYVAHAAMEPHAALAHITEGKVTVWASTQTPFPTRDHIAQALGIDPAKVRVLTPYLGGGFGGKSADLQAIEAARLARMTGSPVQVSWSRAEEFFNDTFDPAAVVRITSTLDADGTIHAFDYVVYAAGDRGASSCYDIPNTRFRSSGAPRYGAGDSGSGVHPFAVGPWRGPGANMNCFAVESQIDLMAAASGQDALGFRLRHLSDPRMRRTLQAAADAFGWKPGVAPSRRGVGIACAIDAGTYVATMAQVRVDADTGRIQVLRVVCAQDMGVVVNPEGARMQAEGAITMGMGYALGEELRFRGGDVLDRNFDTYTIARFSWLPRIETVFVANDALAPQGGGEPPIVTTGAVLANAVFDATGARLFRLPMTPDRVQRALAALPSGI
jgi:isoquinoline 1-oxidoreductase